MRGVFDCVGRDQQIVRGGFVCSLLQHCFRFSPKRAGGNGVRPASRARHLPSRGSASWKKRIRSGAWTSVALCTCLRGGLRVPELRGCPSMTRWRWPRRTPGTTDSTDRVAASIGEPPRRAPVPWPSLGRQVHIGGQVETAERALAEELFQQRDRPHQLQAMVSRYGDPIADLADLRRRLTIVRTEIGHTPISCPDDWAAIRVHPEYIEYWTVAATPCTTAACWNGRATDGARYVSRHSFRPPVRRPSPRSAGLTASRRPGVIARFPYAPGTPFAGPEAARRQRALGSRLRSRRGGDGDPPALRGSQRGACNSGAAGMHRIGAA